jgi:REP element-mobilizing transposase RayT
MLRIARKDLEGKYFHVMVQGIGKEFVFPSDEFKGYYLKCIQKAKERTVVKILGFCVMGNHAHLLLKVDSVTDFTLFMKYANADYAMYYNRVMKRRGYVFRDRFKSEVIKDKKYLIYCLDYIHNNPVKAKIVKRKSEYKFSSFTNYLTQTGLVDFKEASKCYDYSVVNMSFIVTADNAHEFMEHDDIEYEDAVMILEELFKKYNVYKEDIKNNKIILRKIIKEVQERSGISLREIAVLLELNREFIRRIMSLPPSP